MHGGTPWLEPRRWHPAAGPPPAPQGEAAGSLPVVLLLDRRDPLAPQPAAELYASLDEPERQRHAALRRPADRERFLWGRGGLRLLLGSWLTLPPAAVPLAVGRHGKPHCPGGPEFNISHSGDLILLAIHPGRPVGVDVEQARPGLDWRPIARRTLPPEALARLEALPEARQPDGFLGEWCRLEARLKALGTGLVGLETLAPGCPEPQLWPLALPPGYQGAVSLAADAGLTDRRAAGAAPR
jgi:4'-phosphopantetheinyl transferase